MQRLLRRACHAASLARERGVMLPPRFIALIERQYDAVLTEGLAFHEAQPALASPALASPARHRRGRVPRRTGHNLLRRLHGRKPDVSRFLSDPMVPFTNNLAERDGRMMKVRQKISGGFRSVEGAEDAAVIRPLLSTARKQGSDIPQALASQPHRLIEELQSARYRRAYLGSYKKLPSASTRLKAETVQTPPPRTGRFPGPRPALTLSRYLPAA